MLYLYKRNNILITVEFIPINSQGKASVMNYFSISTASQIML